MKKLFFALLLGSLFLLAAVTVVMADNGPHGSFTATTDACASCHRAHSASYGSNALTITDTESLCLSCHGGLGAATDVEDGVYVLAESPYGSTEGTDGASLLGGGFVNALMATAWSGQTSANPLFNAVSRPTTSMHDLGSAGKLWGAGANNSPDQYYVLECVSCHDPHGNAGYDSATGARVASYRLLRWQPQGSNSFTPPTDVVNWSGGAFPTNSPTGTTRGWLVPDNYAGNGNEWYTIGTTNAFAVGDYNAGNATNTYQTGGKNYVPAAVNVAYFCAQCHDRYFNNSRLRNATDISAYCNGGNPATIPPPTSYSDVSPIDATYCIPYQNPSTLVWNWGDNRPSGDNVYMYRHSSGDIRASMDGTVTAGSGTSVSRSCVACHVSHGTTADMTALADAASLATGSTLLRMDNRSVCLRCHANTVGYTVIP